MSLNRWFVMGLAVLLLGCGELSQPSAPGGGTSAEPAADAQTNSLRQDQRTGVPGLPQVTDQSSVDRTDARTESGARNADTAGTNQGQQRDTDDQSQVEEEPGIEEEPGVDSARVERVPAVPGVGRRGRGYGGGLISEPARQYFGLRERIVFQVQIPHTLSAFKALEGRAPRSHEEFMEKIVKENGIQLPDLPAGERYVYDVENEELMVERQSSPAPNR